MAENERQDGRNEAADNRRAVPLTRGLSTKLLLLTILFVMLAEVLIFIPSVANFAQQWMRQRLQSAAAVGIVLMEGDPDSLSRRASNDVLMATGAMAIAVRDGGTSRLLVVSQMPPEIDMHADLDNVGPLKAIRQAFGTMFFGGDRVLRVFGRVGESRNQYEIIIPDSALRSAMLVYARNVAVLSLIISLFTAMLVFYAINRIMIGPIRAMTRSMLAFAAAPDDADRIIRPEDRDDEIGIAERELAGMQETLNRALGERKRLADLGLAVSKINHDMRNMLAAAQLMSDRLAQIKDPTVQSLTPKLVRTLDRAVSYSEGVLAYGRAQEAPPSRRRLQLHALVEDVRATLGIDPASGIEFVNKVDPLLEVHADSEQLFRVLANLCRNAVQAMSGKDEAALVRRLTVSTLRENGALRIFVADTGPGLPPRARENLFTAFRGSARSGGTGLGLAIAQELVRAHGGEISLVESGSGHTVFAIDLPDAVRVPSTPARTGQRHESAR
ncbi:HAMP domain-containing sensor histidine kinase [Chelativorans sp. M5D2P16]|uniref:HAMP domain-containing sensor histidine kinase n=1 Tax=Chelativorans sp. M5D2P16 TaxID=3095678 RepID=UPI002ACA650F|nr:HAMP domain-containing sensor histidine kinase [Chelativorans sp. M5D2P16]MDZ5698966.1 HAMP domain-containing sensor histidine kinase [Chelativorans sp. M5D2P16]